MKLKQAQVWKLGDGIVRIIRIERLAVEYKAMTTLAGADGTHRRSTKKEFCRLLKGATLVEIETAPLGCEIPPGGRTTGMAKDGIG